MSRNKTESILSFQTNSKHSTRLRAVKDCTYVEHWWFWRIELQQIATHIVCKQNAVMKTVLIMMMFVVLWLLYLLACLLVCCLCAEILCLHVNCEMNLIQCKHSNKTKPNTCISAAYNWKLCNWMREREGRRSERTSKLKWLKLRNKNINLVIDRRHDDGLRRW